jgi:hypothetical protein
MAGLHPDAALLPGRSDPTALLAAWCLRKAFLPLVWIGLAVPLLAHSSDAIEHAKLDSVSHALRALFSPLAGLVLALAVRLASAALGFALAYRVTGSLDADGGSARRGRIGWFVRFADRLRLTKAYREIRWTTPVRAEAADRLGSRGKAFIFAERSLTIGGWVLLVGLLVGLSVAPR